MEEKIFVGFQYGRFQTESGQMQDYCKRLRPGGFRWQRERRLSFPGPEGQQVQVREPEGLGRCEDRQQGTVLL